jgi:hypothetical protein
MKNIRILLLTTFALALFAAPLLAAVSETSIDTSTNAPANPNDVTAPGEVDLDLNWFDGLIPLIAPMLVALAKFFVPRIPKPLLPWVAVGAGVVLDQIGKWTGLSEGNAVLGAILGGAAVGVREALTQAKKGLSGNAAGAVGLLLLCGLGAFSFTGCASSNSQTPEQRAARVAMVAELAAYSGTTVYLEKHPDKRPYFVAANAALGNLLSSTNVTPAQLAEALQGLPVRELQGSQGSLIVGNAVILYDSLLRENVNMDANVYLRPVITSIHSGLTRALAQ